MKEIASIYFAALDARRPLYGGTYSIPAVADRNKPFILKVEQKVQRSQEPSPDGKSRETKRYIVTDREIVEDIMREWTKETVGMTLECGPGVWIVRDELPELTSDGTPQFDGDRKPMWRPATPEEKKAMWDEDLAFAKTRDANWAQYLINDGDRIAEDPKRRVMIGPNHKLAARAYGRDREWLEDLKDGDTKVCIFCTKRIASKAIKCPNCQEVVDLDRYAEMQKKTVKPVQPPVAKTA